ncbi:MAG: hypothetical protein ACRES5_07845, partial [Pseudomonas sp.]
RNQFWKSQKPAKRRVFGIWHLITGHCAYRSPPGTSFIFGAQVGRTTGVAWTENEPPGHIAQ